VASARPTYEELAVQLKIAEESLQRFEKLAIAGRYAGAVMHEVNKQLAILFT
jgi:C4-dicarboxylate-specific signal transduction histidine kinase